MGDRKPQKKLYTLDRVKGAIWRKLRDMASSIKSAMAGLFKATPLVGRLSESKRSSVLSASKELVLSTLFSTIPIWFFPIIYTYFFSNTPPLLTNMKAYVDQGDLYIYSSAMIGPLIFAITSNYAEWGAKNDSPSVSRLGRLSFVFPYGVWFLSIAVLISMVAVICFGLMRFESSGFIDAKLNKDSLLTFSIFMYAVSLVCLFLVSVYRNDLSDTSASDARASTADFLKDWSKRNG
ncbi:hypothetical protein [Aminobacter aminovorans]|uniref:Uncharacterized protein n=1 Tax=Aminobacter aminovorans TaxID=83263 RepID=A0ABR6H6M2_AMIAI|nr:hypothetical protein [Aminobacter aminovorans]MBB3706156.1 hypothetical protein [Aminobacter aminovorans]